MKTFDRNVFFGPFTTIHSRSEDILRQIVSKVRMEMLVDDNGLWLMLVLVLMLISEWRLRWWSVVDAGGATD